MNHPDINNSDSEDDVSNVHDGLFLLRATDIRRHRRLPSNPPPVLPPPQGPQASSDDEEVSGLIVPWHRYARQLREVQFVEDAVWRRAWDGDVWCKRSVKRGKMGNEGKKLKELAMKRERDEFEGESDGEE